MAQRVRVDLVDDVDGSPAEESVNFALDGVNYVIDLSAENASKLRDALSLWVDHARRTGGRRTRGRRPTGGPTANEVRQWLRARATRSRSVAASPMRSVRPTSALTDSSLCDRLTRRVGCDAGAG
ncbi:lsr2 family protein [Cutibacterium acnes JCM 18920]|nr:lsr2 family protein [Cutibacterium acnes JCM 18920]